MADSGTMQSAAGSHVVLDHLDLSDPNVAQSQQTGTSKCHRKIPDIVSGNRFQSLDYKNCLYQNDKKFGFVPLNDLMVYTGHEVVWGTVLDIVEAYTKIRNSCIPNFHGT